MKRALISVSDKSGVADFAKGLAANGFEIISTGGTLNHLRDSGVDCISIEEYTGFPEILEGRVKTLHPKVHGGLLSKRDNENHVEELKANDISYIDLICVNLYPFAETLAKEGVSHEEIIENIDIGGPSMLRSAAKNYKFVTVVTEKEDYPKIIKELEENLRYKLEDELRYGENPHQKAAFYVSDEQVSYALQNCEQLHGKKMSYNNIQDASAALDILQEFDETVCVGLKHMNPCGVATGETVYEAWTRAFEADPVSIFGGIVAINGKVDVKTAEKMSEIFLEIILAYDYEDEALEILEKKKNVRIYKIPKKTNKNPKLIKSVRGGILVQDYDDKVYEKLETVTETKVSEEDLKDLEFAYKIVKHVKSNAILLAKNGQTVGVGAGQMNRVGAAEIAFRQAGEKAKGCVLASDAFFPFRDSVDEAAKHDIKAIIQPGGSIRDDESIEACNENGIAMVFTGMRHFKH